MRTYPITDMRIELWTWRGEVGWRIYFKDRELRTKYIYLIYSLSYLKITGL